MTEKTDLSKAERAFVLEWAEAVSGWGLPRSAGRVHALLLLAQDPLAADDLARILSVARSNISTCLRDLTAMGLVDVAPEIGVRRSRYVAVAEPDRLAAAVLAYQKARLFGPAHAALRSTRLEGAAGSRLAALARYADDIDGRLSAPPPPAEPDGDARKPKKKKKKKA